VDDKMYNQLVKTLNGMNIHVLKPSIVQN